MSENFPDADIDRIEYSDGKVEFIVWPVQYVYRVAGDSIEFACAGLGHVWFDVKQVPVMPTVIWELDAVQKVLGHRK